jgi:CheY-like chemotaxis protein
MPGLTGMETLRRLRAQGHVLPVILASGFLDEAQEQELQAMPNVWILRKPYALADLRNLLEEVPGGLRASVG